MVLPRSPPRSRRLTLQHQNPDVTASQGEGEGQRQQQRSLQLQRAEEGRDEEDHWEATRAECGGSDDGLCCSSSASSPSSSSPPSPELSSLAVTHPLSLSPASAGCGWLQPSSSSSSPPLPPPASIPVWTIAASQLVVSPLQQQTAAATAAAAAVSAAAANHALPPAFVGPAAAGFPSASLASAALSSSSSSSTSSAASSRSSSPASQSSSSLLDDCDAFSAGSWHSSSAACLLQATEAVDLCCHAIVDSNALFRHSSGVAVESRRLALTVAVFERSLYAYALRISSARQQQSSRQQAAAHQPQQPTPHQQHHTLQAAHQPSPHAGQPRSSSSGATSASSTPTLGPLSSLHATAASVPPLCPHAPFYPQQGEMDASLLPSAAGGDWSLHSLQSPHSLSYASTIPSSTAHSLAASAIASSARLQHHAFMEQGSFQQRQSSSALLRQPPARHQHRLLQHQHAAAAALPPHSPLSPAAVFPVTSASASLPSAIPPTVSIPQSQWSSPTSAPHPTLPPPPAQLPQQPLQSQQIHQAPSRPPRSRALSASQSPMLAQQAHAASTATRSLSPLDPALLSSASPPPSSRSLLQPPPASQVNGHSPPVSASPSSVLLSSAPAWHQPAGMSCLLRILSHQLMETRAVLLAMNADCSSFPRYCRRLLGLSVGLPAGCLSSMAAHPREVMMAASASALLSLLHSAPPLQRVRQQSSRAAAELWQRTARALDSALSSSAAAFLLSFVPLSFQSSLLTVAAVLSPRVLLPQLRNAVATRAAVTIIPLFLFLLYRLSRYRRIQRLKQLHSRLGLLLRLWHICFSLLDQPQPPAAASSSSSSSHTALLPNDGLASSQQHHRQGGREQQSSSRVPISRWLLELVPPELDASFWYNSSFRLSLVKYGMDVLYSSVQEWWLRFGCRRVGLPYLALATAYFACQPHLAAATASRLMAAPDIAVVRQAWQLLDTPIARRIVVRLLPLVGYAPRLAVCREIELCDVDESEQMQRQASAAGKRGAGGGAAGWAAEMDDEARFERELRPFDSSTAVLRFDGLHQARHPKQLRRLQQRAGLRESLSSLDEESDLQAAAEPTVRLLLLSARPLQLRLNLRFHRVPSQSHVRSARAESSPVLIYLHGGGFFADFRASHLHFLAQWSASLSLPILYVEYSLAPDNAYPTAVNECYDVYRWLLEGRLGLNPERIVLLGDSTGGNLAAALCMKAIMDGLRVPDAVILCCPILNLRLTPTPSRSLYMMDAVLPMNLLLLCRSLYLQSSSSASADADIDPCLSPIVASDALLSQWPTTSILVGGFDPFVDDSVDFAHRLAANGVPVRLRVFDRAPHSLLDFAPLLQQSADAVKLAERWIELAAYDSAADDEQR